MGIYLPNMEMPTTGLYFVSVDNKGRDKPVVTVERMLGNRDVRQIVGMFELISVPEPHGRLGDLDALCEILRKLADNEYTPTVFANWIEHHIDSIIPASKEGM